MHALARIKIKAKVRSRGTRSQNWYPEPRVQILRKKCRTQSLWNLHLAGDWHYNSETAPLGAKPHMMRVMLIRRARSLPSRRASPPPPLGSESPPLKAEVVSSNLAVDQRFANGTQGRLLQWHPGATESKRKALPAYCPDLLARFCKETSLSKQEMLPDIGAHF